MLSSARFCLGIGPTSGALGLGRRGGSTRAISLSRTHLKNLIANGRGPLELEIIGGIKHFRPQGFYVLECRVRGFVSPNGPKQFVLPPPTLMPVGAIGHLIERLGAGAASFPALAFDAEVIGDAFLIDVTEIDPGVLRGARPGDRTVTVPGRSWPVFMTFTRGREQQQKPLFTLKTQVFESGVLDHLTVETGLVVVTADLVNLEMRKPPVCPRS